MRHLRAVVTGGAGFLGSHLCERLIIEGYEVFCLDNYSTGSATNILHLKENVASFRLVETDVTDLVLLAEPIDVVLHFASPASPADYLRLPIETLKAGSVGTLHTLELAREKKARYLLASTSEAYGDPAVHPQPETYWGHVNPVGPRSVYDEAKRFAEAMTVAYRRHYGLDTTIARIFNTHGPRMRQFDGRAVPTFVRQALRNEPVTLAGDGSQTRSIQYVDDLVEGIWLLLNSNHPGPVNIGNPHEISIRALAELIVRLCASSSVITQIDRPEDDPSNRRPDISLARTVLGWEPRVALEEGLLRTISYFRSLD